MKTPQGSEKLVACYNCKYKKYLLAKGAYCTQPTVSPEIFDLVEGQSRDYAFCLDARGSDLSCGKDGRYYSPTRWVKFKTWITSIKAKLISSLSPK